MGRGKRRITKLAIGAIQALLLLSCLAGITAHAQSAKSWNKKGEAAELRQDWDTAYESFLQAHNKDPKDLRYKARLERMRFQASVSHVDRGRVLRQNGDLVGALNEFTRALQIDPGNQTASQEIDQVHPLLQQQNQPGAPPSREQMSSQDEIIKNIGSIAGPVELKPLSNEPIPAIHMVEDVKVIYQAIGKAAGFNVLFDPDYTSKRIPVDLNNVTWSDALHIVGALSGTFYKPVTSNTIFVAQNTRTKRTDLDEEAVQTFYLTNASQQADENEVTQALRNLLDPSSKVNLVPSQNAIVVRSTPDQLLLAQKLLNDLDRARPEVVVDIAILEVNRDRTRNLGITLPQSISIQPQASPSSSSSSSTTTTTTTSSSTTSNFTLNTLANLNATNFAVTVGPGTLTALLSDTDTRILQNPSIRATDGQRATLKIGSKIPVATGSYNAGVSTGVSSIGVQTQFTYLDVGVNIDMTPTVHYDREVSLKLKVEVSAQNGSVTISGVTEPIISQRVSEQTIQLKEGEPSILAGLIARQDTHGVSGTPGLGELPFFKYFFATQSKETQRDEIVFLLIPHIVREPILTRINTRAIDTGTGQSIELRRANVTAGQAAADLTLPVNPRQLTPPGQQTSAANAAAAMVQQLQQQSQPLTPPSPGQVLNTPPGQTPNTGGLPINFTVNAPSANQPVGSTFQVAIMLNGARDVYSVPLQLQFNPGVLELVNVDAGDLLSRDGQAVSIVHRDEGNGLVTISTSRPPNASGVNGQGSIATLTFKATAAGDSNLALVKVGARNSAQANLPAVGSQAVVHVK